MRPPRYGRAVRVTNLGGGHSDRDDHGDRWSGANPLGLIYLTAADPCIRWPRRHECLCGRPTPVWLRPRRIASPRSLRLLWLRPESACDPRLLRPWLDDRGHDPAVLADLAVTGEPELLVGRQGTVEQESGGHRAGALRVSLDGPAAQTRDEVKRTGAARSARGTPRHLRPVPVRADRLSPSCAPSFPIT